MFSNSAKLHFATKCHVGGGSVKGNLKLYGIGCWLNENHVLTAGHVWHKISEKHEWPVAIRYDGLYRCEIIFDQSDSDLLLLKAASKIADASLSRPEAYPSLSPIRPFLGKTVGYLASLKIPEAENEEQYTYFSTSCI